MTKPYPEELKTEKIYFWKIVHTDLKHNMPIYIHTHAHSHTPTHCVIFKTLCPFLYTFKRTNFKMKEK